MLPAHIEDEIQVTPVSMKIKTKWSQVKKQMLPSERENSEKDVNQAAADDVHPAFRNPYLPLPAASTAPEVVTTAGLVTTTFSTDDATAGDSDSTGAENIELEGGTIIKTESLTTAIDDAAADGEAVDEAADEAALKAWRAHCEEMLDEDDDASELHSEDFESPRLHCEEISNDDDDHSEDFELPPLNPMVRKELELLGVDLSEAGLARHVKLAVDKAWASLSTG